jgi:prephenate dehydrogenase
MQTIAIVGVGLIGASFGLALRQAGFAGEIIGVSSEGALAEARAVGAISRSATLDEAARTADLIYLSQTVDRILDTLGLLATHVRPKVLVTDAGSTKVTIVRRAAECLPHVCFLGGHPLAGKEVRGASSADANLFRGRPYVLTPPQGSHSPHLNAFRTALGRMGVLLVETGPEEHDAAMAFTSHLPQLLSTALADTLRDEGNPRFRDLHGPGLLDMTRLALSSPELWSAILKQNREQVLTALNKFLSHCTRLRDAVDSGEVEGVFQSGQQFAMWVRDGKNLRR